MTPAKPPKLLDRVRNTIRLHQYSYETEKTYVGWIRHNIVFHGKRHPAQLGPAEVTASLTHLAVERNVSTQNRAMSTILFLYQKVLEADLP